MTRLKKDVIEDFDLIAKLDPPKWDHNKHYLSYLLKHLPIHCATTLDVGCGSGEFTRMVATKSKSVIGLDFSPGMIERAKKESKDFRNIHYFLGDFLDFDSGNEQFDCIVSIATLHHLPLDIFLNKAKAALKPEGVLLVLDLYENKTISDFIISLLAVPINIVYMLLKTGNTKVSREEELAWNQHAPNDRFLFFNEIKQTAEHIMPGAVLRRHLFWRYSLIWKKRLR